MKAVLQGWQHSAESPVREALSHLRAVQHLSSHEPIVLGYTPVARANPFQAQLYRAFPENGIAAVPILRSRDFGKLLDLSSLARVAVHLHWLNVVLDGIEDQGEARRAAAEFASDLDVFRERGGLVAWTIHNLLPHDARFPEVELELRQIVADRADIIHVMSTHTVDLLRPHVAVDESRVVHVPHPNYAGCYPDSMTRSEARATLGLEPDELVYVLFGAIKPYKGLARLLEAFERFARQTPAQVRLIVAGAPDGTRGATEFVDAAMLDPRVLIAPTKIPSEHVQIFLRAADVGLAPYERVLNSGATHLYETFGLPCIVPGAPQALEALHPRHRVSFRPGDTSSLTEAFHLAAPLATQDIRVGVGLHSDQKDSRVISPLLARHFRRMFEL